MSKYFIFIPNFLSILRIALIYPILESLLSKDFIMSLTFFAIASLTDALDGFLARRMNWQTELGKILDPVADKLLLTGTIFILWVSEYIPLYIFIIFFSRDVAILVGAAIKMTLIESNAPLPNILGKLTTALQIAYIFIIILFELLGISISLVVLDISIVIVTLMSLVVYAYNWYYDIKAYHNE
ncbi:CDP-alcohol phosphatidyltransferase family protein [Gammaproteobacteria bacterium]|jgi:cardiolipin synthase|nr:CDP-alcohol phosphatidyltransferase family protein [Gammaproteobacteria bacterium]